MDLKDFVSVTIGAMETKDFISITISAIALLASIIAAVVAIRRKAYEEERTVRLSLNDVIGRILATRVEQAKFINDHPNYSRNFGESQVTGALSYQLNSFAKLATYLIDKIPHLATDVELNILADTFSMTNDFRRARQYYERAVKNTSDRWLEIVIHQNFA